MQVDGWIDVSDESEEHVTSGVVSAFSWRATEVTEDELEEHPYTSEGSLLVEQEEGDRVIRYDGVKRAVFLALRDFAETTPEAFDAVFEEEVEKHERGTVTDELVR